jgi:hypothetical protein
MNRPTAAAAAALLALCVALSLVAVAHAKPKVPPTPEEIQKKQNQPIIGTVLKIDGTNIIIQTHGKGAGEATIPTDTRTVIELNGTASNLTKIKPGMEIAAQPRTGIATKVAADDGKKKDATPAPTTGKKKKKDK